MPITYLPLTSKGTLVKIKVENMWVKIYGAIYWLLGINYKLISWKIITIYSNN
jgi:hypothetical protein